MGSNEGDQSISPILLVEDSPSDVDLTKRALSRQRLLNPVQVARDGEEALAFIGRWEAGEPLPIFILLDLKLPKISGLEFLRQLKNRPPFSRIPMIVMTTSGEDKDVPEAYRLGCNSYIIQPVEFNKFVEVASQIELYWCVLNTTPR